MVSPDFDSSPGGIADAFTASGRKVEAVTYGAEIFDQGGAVLPVLAFLSNPTSFFFLDATGFQMTCHCHMSYVTGYATPFSEPSILYANCEVKYKMVERQPRKR